MKDPAMMARTARRMVDENETIVMIYVLDRSAGARKCDVWVAYRIVVVVVVQLFKMLRVSLQQ